MSSGVPIRRAGICLPKVSPLSRASLFMLEAKAPGAIAETTMCCGASSSARRLRPTLGALRREVSEFLAATADLKTYDGCRRVVRHGAPARAPDHDRHRACGGA